ncbi:MAG: class I SAM-dependent methyltransferase [Nanoarchaeota archaeon]|nr:class I SAM-dependent methyltransferase [Nanoarchaeota archaeon]
MNKDEKTKEMIHTHFSTIEPIYEQLRNTDLEPILIIKEKLKKLKKIRAADVGCGKGRYDKQLFRFLKKKRLYLTCIDNNENMLKGLTTNLLENKITNFETKKAESKHLPLEQNSLDAVLTFNAVHHFSIKKFLNESTRVLKNKGHLFIYTRLKSQNEESIWGQYFPKFKEKETRLYTLEKLRTHIKETPDLKLWSIEFFEYERESVLKDLVKQIKNCHYSTLCFYKPEEFKEALEQFKKNIKNEFGNNPVTWKDKNIMFIAKKDVKPTS